MREFKLTHDKTSYTLLFDVRNPTTQFKGITIYTPIEKQIYTLCKVTIETGHKSIDLSVDKNGQIKLKNPEIATDLLKLLNRGFELQTTYENGVISIKGITKICKIIKGFTTKEVLDDCDMPHYHSKIEYAPLPCPHDTEELKDPAFVIGLAGTQEESNATRDALGDDYISFDLHM